MMNKTKAVFGIPFLLPFALQVELDVLKRVDHKHIIKLIGAGLREEKPNRFLVLEVRMLLRHRRLLITAEICRSVRPEKDVSIIHDASKRGYLWEVLGQVINSSKYCSAFPFYLGIFPFLRNNASINFFQIKSQFFYII